MKTSNASKKAKRILKVTIKHILNESPDTSWLGEYSNRPTSEFSIDRAHDLDCASQTYNPQTAEAKRILEHAQQTVGDMHNAVLASYNGTLANEKLDMEREALDTAYDELGELLDEVSECDCGEHGDMHRNEYRYFNPSFNYIDKAGKIKPENTAEQVREYVRRDYERMERIQSGDIGFIGIVADAEIGIPSGYTSNGSPVCTVQTITSGGLWGIESDSDREYLESEERTQLSELRGQLKSLGFSSRAISTAFKNVEHSDE